MLASRLAALPALALALGVITAPTAHADQTFSGQVDASDPTATFTQPDTASDACNPAGATAENVHYDTVTFPAVVAGTRRFVLTRATVDDPFSVMYVHRNGACVGADYQPDDASEETAGVADVENVAYAAGDTISVTIMSFDTPARWTLRVEQPEPVPGASRGPAVGRGASFVTLPDAITCVSHTAVVRWTKKAKRLKKALFTAGGVRVGKATKFKPGRKVTLKGIPAGATSITAKLKRKGGGKLTVTRPYHSC